VANTFVWHCKSQTHCIQIKPIFATALPGFPQKLTPWLDSNPDLLIFFRLIRRPLRLAGASRRLFEYLLVPIAFVYLPVFNFAPRGELCPLGVKTHCSPLHFSIWYRVLTPWGDQRGGHFHIGANFTPRGKLMLSKTGPDALSTLRHQLWHI
jgi:hypothetical protein